MDGKRRRWSDNFVHQAPNPSESSSPRLSLVEVVEDPLINTPVKKKRRWSDLFVPAAVSLEDPSPPSSVDMEHEADNDESHVVLRRSTRIRFRSSLAMNEIKELPKVKKLTPNSSIKDIERYYLDKRVKRLQPSLETIYEEPQQVRNKEVIMSSKKYRRVIDFKATNTRNTIKTRKRQMKAKLVTTNGIKRKKVHLKSLMKKLEEIPDE